jgi:hypothetical protein
MKAIARIAKLKGGSLTASEQHISRTRETPNANPEHNHLRLDNAPDSQQTLGDMVRQRGGRSAG